ncbi:universal stress protein [uncultured Brevundimonas sp.]|uniref:universal stress protein n=1 Tax=uncultured Brevundimonas sp. TaxID=213418 RepID=UPI0025F922D1|nr:universal stress protein [uncultured Brevundimonas sp.]
MPAPTVLAATDLTARSDRPLDRAALLAEQLDGAVTVAHVVEGPGFDREQDEEIMRAVRASLPPSLAEAAIVFDHGAAPHVLAELAVSEEAAVIVTGTGRYNGLSDFFLGTAVDHLVRHAEQPVLVVKRRADAPYRSILLATDYSDGALQAFQAALQLFPEARFEVVNAYSVPFETRMPSDEVAEAARAEAEAEMAAFVERAAPPRPDAVRALVAKGDVETVMEQRLAKDMPDLVVIGSHGRSGWVQATLGGKASTLLKRLPSDVLVVRQTRG